jgi:uncharacterized protein
MMERSYTSKRKIFNDPIYGFITIPYEIVYDVIQHPYFQRLRRITQMGLASTVYNGAQHTRFMHVLGAMHLMTRAIAVVQSKGTEITEDEAKAAVLAILLHDIGHGPFSHTLEFAIANGVSHEELSLLFMHKLNSEFDGQLTLAIEIFKGSYQKKFLHQLVSSQLDMDRLDYLKRDSFFSGVSEGVIGSERIITMLNVANDELVVEAKGIYSIEKFIIARRLMYWQVYLHKTVIAAEQLLISIMRRAKHLASRGEPLFGNPDLLYFLISSYSLDDFKSNPDLLDKFAQLDDYDVLGAIKMWQSHSDFILSKLCTMLIDRKLPKIEIKKEKISDETLKSLHEKCSNSMKISIEDASYFVMSNRVANSAYSLETDKINILHKNGSIVDVAEDADLLNISTLATPVHKYFICYPKIL